MIISILIFLIILTIIGIIAIAGNILFDAPLVASVWDGAHPLHEEPLEYQSDVIFKFQILSNKGYSIKNILEEQLNKPSDFIRSFSPIYEIIDENKNAFELKMIMAPYKLHHSQIIELLSDNGLISGEDYNLNWIFGSWNRKTKEFKII